MIHFVLRIITEKKLKLEFLDFCEGILFQKYLQIFANILEDKEGHMTNLIDVNII